MEVAEERNKKEEGGGGTRQPRRRTKGLLKKLQEQIEFYFGDANLPKDKFLKQKIQEHPEGYVLVEVIASFNRMKKLTSDTTLILQAIENSALVELSEDRQSVRRVTSLPEIADVDLRTIYVENLPSQSTDHDSLKKLFGVFGTILYISLPRHKASGQIKGFAFIEFSTQEEATTALEYFQSGCKVPQTPTSRKPSEAGWSGGRGGRGAPVRQLEVGGSEEGKETQKRKREETEDKQGGQSAAPEDLPPAAKRVRTEGSGGGEDPAQQTGLKETDHTQSVGEMSELQQKPGADSEQKEALVPEHSTTETESTSKEVDGRETATAMTESSGSVDETALNERSESARGISDQKQSSVLHQSSKLTSKEPDGTETDKAESRESVEEVRESTSGMEVTEREEPSRKRKRENSGASSESLGEPGKEKQDELSHKAPRLDSQSSEGVWGEEGEGEEVKGRKKKNRQHKKKDKWSTLKEMNLRVLPKKEWQEMKQLYREMQKDQMKQLKTEIQERGGGGGRREGEREGQGRGGGFVAHCLVRVECAGEEVTAKQLKEVCSKYGDVVYVDFKDGNKEGYVRYGVSGCVEKLVESEKPTDVTFTAVEEEDERAYFLKTQAARKQNRKLKQKGRRNQRGQDRIISKALQKHGESAAQAKGAHIRFSDSDGSDTENTMS